MIFAFILILALILVVNISINIIIGISIGIIYNNMYSLYIHDNYDIIDDHVWNNIRVLMLDGASTYKNGPDFSIRLFLLPLLILLIYY